MKALARLWLTGKTLVITIPKEIRDIKELRSGDIIEIDYGEVVKRNSKRGYTQDEEEKKAKKKELPKI